MQEEPGDSLCPVLLLENYMCASAFYLHPRRKVYRAVDNAWQEKKH